MKLDVNACAEHAAQLRKFANTDVNDCLGRIASILSTVDGNEKVDELMGALGKMENDYNDNILPKLEAAEKVLTEQIPELDAKIKSLTIDVVKSGNTDQKVAEIDVDEVKIV